MTVEVLEFRFLTNGMLTSQVVYATPVAERIGAGWLVIAWAPAVVTTLIGYGLYLARHHSSKRAILMARHHSSKRAILMARQRWLTGVPLLNAGMWFATAYFLIIDKGKNERKNKVHRLDTAALDDHCSACGRLRGTDEWAANPNSGGT